MKQKKEEENVELFALPWESSNLFIGRPNFVSFTNSFHRSSYVHPPLGRAVWFEGSLYHRIATITNRDESCKIAFTVVPRINLRNVNSCLYFV